MLSGAAVRSHFVVVRRSFSSSSVSGPVGFVGLGNMGAHMAHNLLKKGVSLFVFDVNKAALDLAQSRGAKVVSSPKELAQQATTVITMLPASAHVMDVYTNASFGIFRGLRPNALLIDSSTIDPVVARDISAQAINLGAAMVDAPVSGGVTGAEAGTLTFMCGGPDDTFARAKPLLEMMGKNIVHCGPAGSGQVVKVCNNLILGISMGAVSEGMNLGVKLGMDPAKLASIINTSSGRCWSSDTYNPCPGVFPNVPSAREYKGGFGTTLMRKDMRLAVDAAGKMGVPLPLGSQALQMYEMIAAKEQMDVPGQDRDFSYYYQFLQPKKP